MMKRTIILPIKAFSINRMTARDSRYKTSAYRDWSYQVFHLLSSENNLNCMKDLREYFDEDVHAYIIDLTTYYPEEFLITKKGTISARAFDTTNVEKPLVDLIFDPKYFDSSPPYGCKNLNIDDKYLLDCHSKKRIADDYKIELEIQIIEKDSLLERHVVDDEN